VRCCRPPGPELALKLGLSIDRSEAAHRSDPPSPACRSFSRLNPSQCAIRHPRRLRWSSEDQYVACSNREGLPHSHQSGVSAALDKGAARTTRERAPTWKDKFRLRALLNQVGRAAPEDHPQSHTIINFQPISRPPHRSTSRSSADVRERIGMTSPPLSRVVTNKYHHTPRAVFR